MQQCSLQQQPEGFLQTQKLHDAPVLIPES